MKKTLVYGTATAAVVLALGSSVAVTQCGRNVETLYGPPPSVQDNDDPVEDLYGPPVAPEAEYDNTDEPIEDVYGPPVDSDMYTVVDESDGTKTEAIQPALYGPPVDNPIAQPND